MLKVYDDIKQYTNKLRNKKLEYNKLLEDTKIITYIKYKK